MEREKASPIHFDFDEDLPEDDLGEAIPLTKDDPDSDFQGPQCLSDADRKVKRPSSEKTYWPRLACIAVLFALAAWGAVDLAIKAIYAIHQTRSCSCGSSIAEALSRNCVFDPLVPAWVPPHCRDDELTEEFRYQGPPEHNSQWPYYSAMENGTRLTEDEVALLADVEGATFYSTHEFHVVHCLYSWLKTMRGPERWLVEPRRTRGEFHVRHCHNVVMKPVSMDQVVEGIPAGLFSLNADLVKQEDENHH